MNFKATVLFIIAAVLFAFILGMGFAGAEELRRPYIVVTANPQAMPLLRDCVQDSVYHCQLTSSQVDDLHGYAGTQVLSTRVLLPAVQR